jgi:hypothetical protein
MGMIQKKQGQGESHAGPAAVPLVGRDDERMGLGVDALKRAFLDRLVYSQGALSGGGNPA